MIAGKIKKKNKIFEISVDKIACGKFTTRKHFDEREMNNLIASVKNFGVLQPVTVRKLNGVYELISGERRVRAAKAAGLSTVPAILVETKFDIAAAIAITENQQRQKLLTMEDAQSCMALIKRRGLSCEEMAEMIGLSANDLVEKLEFLELPKKVRDVLQKYDLTKKHIEAVSVIENEKDKAKLLSYAGREKYSPERLKNLAQSINEDSKITVKKQVVKDVKIFINTIMQSVEMIKKTGAFASATETENDQYIEYVIKIEK